MGHYIYRQADVAALRIQVEAIAWPFLVQRDWLEDYLLHRAARAWIWNPRRPQRPIEVDKAHHEEWMQLQAVKKAARDKFDGK